MKKDLLVVSLISVLLLAGCNKNEEVNNEVNNNVPEVTDNQHQEEIVEDNIPDEQKVLETNEISSNEKKEIVKKAWLKALTKDDSTKNYRIDNIELEEGEMRDFMVDNGEYEEDDILAVVTYAIEVNPDELSTDDFAGNAKLDGNWLVQTNVGYIRNGEAFIGGTGW